MPPTRETMKDRATRNAEQRKALAEGALPTGTSSTDLDLTGRNGGDGEAVVKDPLAALLDRFQPEIEKQFPLQLKINPSAWMRMALTGMRTSKQAAALARCDRPSLFAALLESARYGLTPFTDEAAIVPYGTTATFIPMAQGFVKMFWNSNQVRGVVVDFIRKNEVRGRDWEVSRGSAGEGFWHRPRYIDEETFEPVEPGEPMLAYCYLRFTDGTCSEPAIVTRWDAENVMRTRSRAWQNAENLWKTTDGRRGRDSLWHTDFPAMWLKTSVRRAAKYGPKSAELQELLLIEAREDRTRPDARQAPPPPVSEVEGVDWNTDIAGGKVVQSTVVRDGAPAEPAGHQAPPPGDEWPGGARPPADVPLPGEQVSRGTTEPPGPAEEAPAGDGPVSEPANRTGERVTRPTAGRIGRLFQQIGWVGDEYAPRRLVIAGLLTDLTAKPPFLLATPMGMSEAQGLAAEANFNDLLARSKTANRDPGEVLQAMYERLTATGAPVEDPPGDPDDSDSDDGQGEQDGDG